VCGPIGLARRTKLVVLAVDFHPNSVVILLPTIERGKIASGAKIIFI
jgi:hypothetical protein